MNTVQPIREKAQIEAMKNALSPRDRLMFVIGINSGLRISDILQLKVGDIRNQDVITVREQKTRKAKRFRLNGAIKREFKQYLTTLKRQPADDEYLFQSRKGKNQPITRFRAYRVLNDKAKEVGITDKIGCHSLRKTFGYHAYKAGVDLALLQSIFNHSSQAITLRYIGIQQDDIDEVYANIEL